MENSVQPAQKETVMACVQGNLNKSSTLHLSVEAIFNARTVEGT